MTTTSTPSTTEKVGCCYGEGVKESERRGNKVGRDQCERGGKGEFRECEDADFKFIAMAPWPRSRRRCALIISGAMSVNALVF